MVTGVRSSSSREPLVDLIARLVGRLGQEETRGKVEREREREEDE